MYAQIHTVYMKKTLAYVFISKCTTYVFEYEIQKHQFLEILYMRVTTYLCEIIGFAFVKIVLNPKADNIPVIYQKNSPNFAPKFK